VEWGSGAFSYGRRAVPVYLCTPPPPPSSYSYATADGAGVTPAAYLASAGLKKCQVIAKNNFL